MADNVEVDSTESTDSVDALPKRCDRGFHKRVCRVTESSVFNAIIIFTIFANAFFMALETGENFESDPQWEKAFEVLDSSFLIVYSVEFILKVYAEPVRYWRSSYNLFDFLVLVISWVQSLLTWAQVGQTKLGSLRVLRALRTLRTLRTVSFIRGVQVLVTALIDTIRKWVINILMLLLLLMFLFAIMGYYFFGYRDDGDKKNWGTLGAAMLTLFSYVTVDGWTDLQGRLDDKDMGGSRVYTIVFIYLGHFIFTNVFIGVIIMNISEATDQYKSELQAEREALMRQKKDFMMARQHNDVKQMLERQKRGQYSNFHDMVSGFMKTLGHDDSILMSDLSTNLIWLETFNNTLDHMDATMFRVQQLHFEMANTLANAMETRTRKKFGA